MKERSVAHSTFVIERTFDAAPPRVFKAFSDPASKALWFHGPEEWPQMKHELDFRVGGRERNGGGPVGGPVHLFECRYHDIVPNERIVYTYEMYLDDARISVSVATIELKPAGKGTKLVLTEQGAFLDGHDSVDSRERGTQALMDALGASLE
jgi:uncharacterized protein YndB with AHSA1/START domain